MVEKKLCRDCKEAEAMNNGLCYPCYRDWYENHCETKCDEQYEVEETKEEEDQDA